MQLRNPLLLVFLCASITSFAQGTACFKPGADNNLEMNNDIDLSQYNGFFVGEFHGVYGVSEIKLAMIKYLNKTYAVTDVFMEIGYSAAWLYNQYLTTGDTTLFTSPVLVYAQKQPNRDLWKGLYEYNKGLTNKITIHGADFERIEFLKVLKLLMPPGKEKPGQIADVLTYVDTVSVPKGGWLRSSDHLAQDSLYLAIRETFQQNIALFEQYFGANYSTVADIMLNDDTYRQFGQRNKTMYQNMMKQIKRSATTKFVAFYGLHHTNAGKSGTLFSLVRKKRQFRNKVVNMAMVCRNCYDWQLKPEYRNAAFRAPYTYLEDTVLLKTIYEKYTSPQCRYTMIPSVITGDDKVSRYSDYIILMKDQPEF